MTLNQHTTYQSLLELTNLLISEACPDVFFKYLATFFQEKFECNRVSLSIYNAETDSLDWFAVAWGVNVTKMDGRQALRGPIAKLAIKSKQLQVVPHLHELADDPAIKYMVDAGLRSAIAFPLISCNVVVAAIVISYAKELPNNIAQLKEIIEILSPQLALTVENMLFHERLKQQDRYLQKQIDPIFFYNCASMKKVMYQIKTIAKSDVPVLLHGETGTGKEFLARYIHNNSKRYKSNFVKVSCPALSPTLFESELFGHAKGAFTGALNRRIGRFELANKGSIFLDEIGELDIVLQVKFLHVLQDASFERVGESSPIDVDIRIISATNADLYKMMREGSFRRDLFYRMGATTIQIPPLRDREGEILLLFDHLMKLYAFDMKIAEPKFHTDTLKILEKYDWPGNIRELSNMISRLLVLHSNDIIGPEHVLPLLESCNSQTNENYVASKNTFEFSSIANSQPVLSNQKNDSLANVEKVHIEHVLKQTFGRVGGPLGAAKLLNIPRTTLQYKLKKLKISPKDFM